MATAGCASVDSEGVFHRGSGWSIQGKRDGISNGKGDGDGGGGGGEGEGDHERNLAPEIMWRTRWVCFLAFFLFNVPMFAFLPGIINYIVARRCETLGLTGHCDDDRVNASAADYTNWVFALPCNVPNALTALALGTLSDRHGRRPLMLLCVTAQCAGSLGALLVMLFHLDIWWFVPGFVINGLGGASWVFVVLIMAALADTSKDDQDRAQVFGGIMGLYYFSSAVGPLLGGQISHNVGHVIQCSGSWCHGGELQAVFALFFITNLIVVVLVLVCFKETVPAGLLRAQQRAARESCERSNQSGCWMHFLAPTLAPVRVITRSKQLTRMTVVYSICFLGMSDRSGLVTLYAKKEPFDMDNVLLGWFLAAIGTARAFAVLAVFPALLWVLTRWNRRPGLSEQAVSMHALTHAARLGIVAAVVFTAALGLVTDVRSLFLIASVEGLDAIWDTALRVLFVAVGSIEGAGEGEVLGVIGFLQVFIGSLAPTIFQTIYAETVHWCPPFTFYLIAGLTCVGLLVTFTLSYGGEEGKARSARGARIAEEAPLLASRDVKR